MIRAIFVSVATFLYIIAVGLPFLIHARITGVRRDGDRIVAELELPEAFQ